MECEQANQGKLVTLQRRYLYRGLTKEQRKKARDLIVNDFMRRTFVVGIQDVNLTFGSMVLSMSIVLCSPLVF